MQMIGFAAEFFRPQANFSIDLDENICQELATLFTIIYQIF
jgi:hypothetical protein